MTMNKNTLQILKPAREGEGEGEGEGGRGRGREREREGGRV